MRKVIMLFAFVALLVLAASAHAGATSQGKENISFSSGIHEATDLLAKVKFDFPAEGAKLWEKNDGLLMPQDPQFARNAARFLAEHPIPPAEQRNQALWDTRNTPSRQFKCLAYLASGKKGSRREVAGLAVAQARRLQWTFPIQGYRQATDRTFYAAAGSLALTGSILRSEAKKNSSLYEVGTQWLRTGAGQFSTYGGRGDNNWQKAAKALIGKAGEEKAVQDLHGLDEEFFGQIDLTRPKMQTVAKHVASGDWSRARRAYEDVLAERFSSKRGWPDLAAFGDLVALKAVNVAEADDICRNIFILKAHMFKRYDFGDQVDWAKVIDNDIESRVWMNVHLWMRTLLQAYRKTGDEKYIKHLCRLFNSWYETSPPSFKRSSAQWRTLEVGNRLSLTWSTVLLELSEHPMFQRECLFNMARSVLDHGRYLSMYAAGGGNWLQVESSGLACAALLFPEFKLSPLFYKVGMNRLAWINTRAFLPDGFQSECSPGYHFLPLMGIASALRLATFLEAPVPESLMKQYEAGIETLQYIAYPDRTLPMLSDWNPQRHSAVEVFKTGAEVFGREDFQWFATDGREGTPPTETSHDFTHAGYCVMRDKWEPEGQVLIFDAGYFGSGHQHEDKLNFVYYAGGRELIGDPGIYSYKYNEYEPYWRGTWSHNTIVIDGLSQHRALGPAEAMPDPDRRFVKGEGFDFAAGWYRWAYSPRKSRRGSEMERKATIRNVQHQRCIFYVKSEYAILCDRVVGRGEHQVDILFHPAPVILGEGAKQTARAVDLEIMPKGVVVTQEAKHANIAIIPAKAEGLEVLDLIGRKDPVRGWYALYGLIPSHDIVYRCRTELPRHFETVVQPLPPGYTQPMKVESRQVNCEEGKTCAALKCASDLFLICYDGPTEMSCADIRFHGTALMLTLDASRRPVQALMVDGRALSIGGNQVFSTDTPMPARSIELHKAWDGLFSRNADLPTNSLLGRLVLAIGAGRSPCRRSRNVPRTIDRSR